MYTAPEKGALLVSCWGIASGFAIGSAIQKVNDETTRPHGAKNRIALTNVNMSEEDAGRAEVLRT
jgi:hypothetical protein